jgi:hypothetical protein
MRIMSPLRQESLLLVLACVAASLSGLAIGPGRAQAGTPPDVRSAAPGSSAAPPGDDPGKSPEGDTDAVVYPAQRIALKFDHARHAKLGTGCVYCHEQATKSRASRDRLLPPPSRCDACHGTSHDHLERVLPGTGAAAACSYCHEARVGGPETDVARTVLPPANLRFDHAAHSSRGMGCATCHAGVERTALATTRALPKMTGCTSCHEVGGSAKAGCDVCHPTTVGGRLKTHFPSGKLMPGRWMGDAQHGPDWTFRHKLVAGANSEACATCHSEEECVECHDGRVRPRRVHPNDWLSMHPTVARQEEASCTSCHRTSSFCLSCHQRTGVAMSGPTGNAPARGRFHPPKAEWTDLPRTSRHHAWEAQRNITACVSCHTERDCATCHATASQGGRGGLSPHPAGFAGACGSAFSKNPRPCLFCHDASDPSLARCR